MSFAPWRDHNDNFTNKDINMNKRHLKLAVFLSLAWLSQAVAQAGQVTLFSREGFDGRELSVREGVRNLTDAGFNDRAESMIIRSGRWEICEHADFRGNCRVFGPGEYRQIGGFGNQLSSLREVSEGRPQHGGWPDRDDHDDRGDDRPGMGRDAPVVLFAAPGLRGRALELRADNPNLSGMGFNDQALSMSIQRGQWEFCVHSNFGGDCRVFGPGQYRMLDGAFARSISSVRHVGRGGPGRGEGNYGHGGGQGPRDNHPNRRDGVELFSAPGFGGERVPVRDHQVNNLNDLRFNDRAGSLIVSGGQWEFCQHSDFRGQCMTYGPGRYDRLGSLHNQISSIRRVR